MYFFKGNKYFRLNVTAGQLDVGYPKPIGDFWKGVPQDLDAAFRYEKSFSDLTLSKTCD